MWFLRVTRTIFKTIREVAESVVMHDANVKRDTTRTEILLERMSWAIVSAIDIKFNDMAGLFDNPHT